ncbi:ParB/RepB/Spo0J family partition protein [Nonomuraea sp. NPDC050556]|uniref:ParB/RepB/Spo0J family partition protein n=1 Tax=Nonomuraea sp. NPDC050556 TaxID=3364369 RepID=UPI00379C08C3
MGQEYQRRRGQRRTFADDDPTPIAPHTYAPPTELPLTDLTENPLNPRKVYRKIEELAASMTERGVLQPLLITPRSKFIETRLHLDDVVPRVGYVIIAGHRRIQAARLAGLHEVPVYVRMDATAALEEALIENIQRDDLSEIDEAETLKTLMDAKGWTQSDVAKSIGKTQSFVSQRMALLKLPDEMQQDLREGKITVREARSVGAKKQTKPRSPAPAPPPAPPPAVPEAAFTDQPGDEQRAAPVVTLADRRAAKPVQDTLFTVGLPEELTRDLIELADQLRIEPEDALAQAAQAWVSTRKNT